MRKVLDPLTGTVHLLDRRKKGPYGLFYLCACGRSSGIVWENIAQSTPLGCLVCLMHENGKKS